MNPDKSSSGTDRFYSSTIRKSAPPQEHVFRVYGVTGRSSTTSPSWTDPHRVHPIRTGSAVSFITEIDIKRVIDSIEEFHFLNRSLRTEADRDRAQVDPRVAGLLVVALGLAFIGVITVGAIVP